MRPYNARSNSATQTLSRVATVVFVFVLIFLAVSFSRNSMNQAVEQKTEDIEEREKFLE
jgi:lipopolysaccharide export LptBFGC system permease protein LptF